MCIYTHLTPCRLYKNYRCYQITMQWNVFYTNGGRCVVLAGYCHWGFGFTVTGPIQVIGKLYPLLLKQEIAAAHSYCHIFLLIPLPLDAFIRNTIIILCINLFKTKCNPLYIRNQSVPRCCCILQRHDWLDLSWISSESRAWGFASFFEGVWEWRQ